MTDSIDDFVFVDIETTGLDVHKHNILEVAYAVGNGPIITLYPEFHPDIFSTASVGALEVNKFFERFAGDDNGVNYAVPDEFADFDEVTRNKWLSRFEVALTLPLESTDGEWEGFVAAIKGRTIVGANPRFDVQFIEEFLSGYKLGYSHRLWDVQNYAAGKYGWIKPRSFADVARHLGRVPGDHTAAGDVRVTRQVFLDLTAGI